MVDQALGLSAARAALGEAVGLEGEAFVQGLLGSLRIESVCGEPLRDKVPAGGPVVIVANHHFGAVDALLALSLILPVRPDLRVVANGSLALFPQMRHLTIPVSAPSVRWQQIQGTRDIVRHLRGGGAILIFPSGRVAGRDRAGRVEDGPWSPGTGRLVRMSWATVVPVAFEGRNSRLFYLARSVHFRLGTFLLLRELLNKKGGRIPVNLGSPIPYSNLSGISDPHALAEHLRSVTYGLLRKGP